MKKFICLVFALLLYAASAYAQVDTYTRMSAAADSDLVYVIDDSEAGLARDAGIRLDSFFVLSWPDNAAALVQQDSILFYDVGTNTLKRAAIKDFENPLEAVLDGEDLQSACTDGQVLGGDGSGGLECQADVSSGASIGAGVVAAFSVGSPAAEEIDAAGTYEVLPTALTETVDSGGNWSVQSSNYLCYNGTDAINDARLMFAFSTAKTEQATQQEVTFKFATEQQSTLPMTDGDEFGEAMQRSFDGVDDYGLGALQEVVDIVQNDCFGIMMTTNISTPTIQLQGGTIIVDTGGGTAVSVDGAANLTSVDFADGSQVAVTESGGTLTASLVAGATVDLTLTPTAKITQSQGSLSITAGSATWDWDVECAAILTVDENVNITTSNTANASACTIKLTQDGTGGRTVSINSVSIDVFSAASDSTTVSCSYMGSGLTCFSDAAATEGANGYSAQQYAEQATLTDGATINWNLNNSQSAIVTLAGNRTLAAPTNQQAGGTYVLIIKQDATGSRTLTFNAAYEFPGGTDPTLSTGANSVDAISCVSDGTDMFCSSVLDFQ